MLPNATFQIKQNLLIITFRQHCVVIVTMIFNLRFEIDIIMFILGKKVANFFD